MTAAAPLQSRPAAPDPVHTHDANPDPADPVEDVTVTLRCRVRTSRFDGPDAFRAWVVQVVGLYATVLPGSDEPLGNIVAVTLQPDTTHPAI